MVQPNFGVFRFISFINWLLNLNVQNQAQGPERGGAVEKGGKSLWITVSKMWITLQGFLESAEKRRLLCGKLALFPEKLWKT